MIFLIPIIIILFIAISIKILNEKLHQIDIRLTKLESYLNNENNNHNSSYNK